MNPAWKDVNSSRCEFDSEPFIAEACIIVRHRVQRTECFLQFSLVDSLEAPPLPVDKDAEVSMADHSQVSYASTRGKIDLKEYSPLDSYL